MKLPSPLSRTRAVTAPAAASARCVAPPADDAALPKAQVEGEVEAEAELEAEAGLEAGVEAVVEVVVEAVVEVVVEAEAEAEVSGGGVAVGTREAWKREYPLGTRPPAISFRHSSTDAMSPTRHTCSAWDKGSG